MSEDREKSATLETTKTPLDVDDLKFAIEDARLHQAAHLEHIRFNHSKAMSFLSLYSTVGIAAASGATAGFAGATAIPGAASCALTAATLVLVAGCWFCYRAMRREIIYYPARSAEFWLWAITQNKDPAVQIDGGIMRHACVKYLEDLNKRTSDNKAVLRRADPMLERVKQCGLIAPTAALAVGALASAARWLVS